jgi:hypothetical protein
MAKLSIGEKAHRVLKFIMGLRTPGAVSALSRYGFIEADLRTGVERLNAVTQVRLKPEPVTQEPQLLAALNAFEGEWFSIAQATLKHAQPEIAEWLFAGLPATQGPDVAVAVKTFIDRVEALESGATPFGERGVAARALLLARGLTAERIADAKATGAGLATLVVDTGTVSVAERDAAEKAMWGWYLEWSTIARTAIKERYLLRALGFRRNQKADELEGEGEERETESASDGAAPSATPPALALPARASTPDDMRRSTPA